MGDKSPAYRAYMLTDDYKRKCKIRELNRARGVKMMTDAAPTQELLRYWIDVKGVRRTDLAQYMGVSVSAIQHHYQGFTSGRRHMPLVQCRVAFAKKVERGVRLITADDWNLPMALPIRRRVRALVAAGYTFLWLGEQLGRSTAQVHQFAHGDSVRCKGDFAAKVVDLYAKYAYRSPLELNEPEFRTSYAKGVGRKYGWPDPNCWDEDTIDDPYSLAEWTGKCGTLQGYRVHQREHIAMCPECKTANTIYRTFPTLAVLMGVVAAERVPPTRTVNMI